MSTTASLSKTLRVNSLVADSVTDKSRSYEPVTSTTVGTGTETTASVSVASLQQDTSGTLVVVRATRTGGVGLGEVTGLLLLGATGETTAVVGTPTPASAATPVAAYTLAADGVLTVTTATLADGDAMTLTVSRA